MVNKSSLKKIDINFIGIEKKLGYFQTHVKR